MSQDTSGNRPVTLSVDDIERLVNKVNGLESVVRELVEYFSCRSEPFGPIAANRMLLTLSEDDIGEWLRRKIQE